MATPTPDANYLVQVQPTDTLGVKWAEVGAWMLQTLINAGISMTSNPPFSDPISPTDTEGMKWAKLGYYIQQLSGGIGPPVATVIKSGLVAIGNNVSTVTGTFSPAFASAPKGFTALIIKTDGTKSNYFVTGYTVTANGYTVDLQAPTDDATYKLSFIASL